MRHLIQALFGYGKVTLMIIVLPLGAVTHLDASSGKNAKMVTALDTKYQVTVKSNDAAAMDQILADDFILVTGRGKSFQRGRNVRIARGTDSGFQLEPHRLFTAEGIGKIKLVFAAADPI
jgi:hypothetical protein